MSRPERARPMEMYCTLCTCPWPADKTWPLIFAVHRDILIRFYPIQYGYNIQYYLIYIHI